MDRADQAMNQELQRQDDDATVLGDQAVVRYLRGDRQAAEEPLGRAWSCPRKPRPAWNNLGVMLAEMGDADRAAETFDRAMGNDKALANVQSAPSPWPLPGL